MRMGGGQPLWAPRFPREVGYLNASAHACLGCVEPGGHRSRAAILVLSTRAGARALPTVAVPWPRALAPPGQPCPPTCKLCIPGELESSQVGGGQLWVVVKLQQANGGGAGGGTRVGPVAGWGAGKHSLGLHAKPGRTGQPPRFSAPPSHHFFKVRHWGGEGMQASGGGSSRQRTAGAGRVEAGAGAGRPPKACWLQGPRLARSSPCLPCTSTPSSPLVHSACTQRRCSRRTCGRAADAPSPSVLQTRNQPVS